MPEGVWRGCGVPCAATRLAEAAKASGENRLIFWKTPMMSQRC